jgi:serine protease Do
MKERCKYMNNRSDWNENEDRDSIMEVAYEKVQERPNVEITEQRKKGKAGWKTYLALVLVTSLISSTAVGGILYSKFSGEMKKQSELFRQSAVTSLVDRVQDNPAIETGNVLQTALAQGSTVTQIARKASPSVVGIRMTTSGTSSRYFSQLGEAKAEGSGVIVSGDGYIMTNYHVVEYADPKNQASRNTTLEVFLPDKRQAKARFIGGDSKNDLAVVKIDLKDLPVAELGDSSKLEVGELAVAIGNPLGMEFAGSVTAGVVSALDRMVTTEDKTLKLIQTDAAINPGNSGGALVNSKGQVIGINTIKISVTGVEGLGFAIPINDAKPIVDQLTLFGYVKGRPLIGISGREITQALAEQYNLPVGIYILDVTAGSGADKAGMKKGDILVSLDGKAIQSMLDLDEVKKGHKAGDTVNATVMRDGKKVSIKLTFSEEK